MSDKDPMPELVIYLKATEKNESFNGGDRLYVEAAVLQVEQPGDKLRNISTLWSSFDPACGYAGLTINASIWSKQLDWSYYGYKAEFTDVYSVNLERAQAMVAILKKLERGLAKLEREFGPPGSYPDYLVRVASVLGIKRFVTASNRPASGWPSYDDLDLRYMGPSDARYWVERREFEFKQKHEEQGA